MTPIEKLLQFCDALNKHRVSYDVRVNRPEAVPVALIATPGEYWEIEFFADGEVEVERFMSQGVEEDADAPAQVLGVLDEEDG